MAEEIKKEEIMSEEELDEVAGGSTWEIHDSANRLRNLGIQLPAGASAKDVNDAMWHLGQKIIMDGKPVDLGSNLKDNNESNSYYINHRKVNHQQVWDFIYKNYKGGY